MSDSIDMNSILTSVKKAMGIAPEYTHFDPDIIMHINSVFLTLEQLGVGPAEGFAIEDEKDKWSDFIGNNKLLNAVKSWTYLKVRLLFDPPQSSAAVESINRMIAEFEWRINVTVDPGEEDKDA